MSRRSRSDEIIKLVERKLKNSGIKQVKKGTGKQERENNQNNNSNQTTTNE